MKPDEIEIRRLVVETHIGVPDEERANPQTLWITVLMLPSQGFSGLADSIANTIDYHRVALDVAAIAKSKRRNLIETLACEIADALLRSYPIVSIEITVEKRILPDTDFVAVRIVRDSVRIARNPPQAMIQG